MPCFSLLYKPKTPIVTFFACGSCLSCYSLPLTLPSKSVVPFFFLLLIFTSLSKIIFVSFQQHGLLVLGLVLDVTCSLFSILAFSGGCHFFSRCVFTSGHVTSPIPLHSFLFVFVLVAACFCFSCRWCWFWFCCCFLVSSLVSSCSWSSS